MSIDSYHTAVYIWSLYVIKLCESMPVTWEGP